MIKKISNWLVGSFFRTIGRFLAIAGIVILFYIIASKSGLKLTDLLGISRVYADETFTYSSSLWSYTSSSASNCNVSLRNCTINSYVSNLQLNNPQSVDYINTIRLYAYASDTNKFKSSNYYNFKYEVCQSNKDFNKIKTGRGFSWQYNTSNAATGSTAGDPTQFSYRIDDKVGDNNCYYLTFSAKPPVDSRYIGFFFTYTGYGDNPNIAVIPDIDYFNSTGGSYNVKSLSVTYSQDVNATIQNSTNQIINNQNENTNTIINNQNENTEQIIDTLTDDTINNSDIENGLDLDYDTSQSYGAFSGFLLLPLTWVQQILAPQDSCSAINLPLPYMENKYLTLPCMNEFWNSMGLVADLISLVWIAVVGVRIFNGLYLLVVDVTSTEDNAEKLDKVRSWEL